MKNLFVFIAFPALLVLAVALLKITKEPPESPVLGTENVELAPLRLHRTVALTYDGREYKAVWAIADASETSLIQNFTDKKTAKTVFDEFGCEILANGGFYETREDKSVPIGLFISNTEELSVFRNNSLFNGILSINEFGTPRITVDVPEDALVHAVQTGPVLIENDFMHRLSLVRDKDARRAVAAVTGSNELLFIAVYDAKMSLSGPRLSDLPAIITQLENENDLNIADAINLDGGAASALYTKDFSLSEASPVGSFFCAR